MNEADTCRMLITPKLQAAELNALKHLHTETAAGLDALLPAVLDRAFKGELR